MYYTEKEIMTQHEALEETYIYFEKRKQEIQQFFLEKKCRKFMILEIGRAHV